MSLSEQEEEEIQFYLKEFNEIKNNIPYIRTQSDEYRLEKMKRLEFINVVLLNYMKKHETLKISQYDKERKEKLNNIDNKKSNKKSYKKEIEKKPEINSNEIWKDIERKQKYMSDLYS